MFVRLHYVLGVIDFNNSLTSDSLYLLCPPKVLIEVILPALAHLVTVFGSTLNSEATSAGVNSFSWLVADSGEKLDWTKSVSPRFLLKIVLSDLNQLREVSL